MWENCSVGCEQEGCSRKREPEQRTTDNQSPLVSRLHNKEAEKECTQRNMITGIVAEYYQRNEKQRWLSCIQRNMITGIVAEYYQRNGKQRWLSWKLFLSLTGTRWNALGSGLTCPCLLLRKTTFAAWFWTICSLYIWSQLMPTSKQLQ